MAAQDAELQLKVSLDLAFFKQQLAGLGSEAAGYRLPINIKFNRLSIQKELNTLGANIKKRTYRLNVETNIAAEISNAEKLAKALVDLEQASKKIGGVSKKMAPTGMVGAVIDDKTTYKQLQALYKFAKEANLPFEKLAKGAASSTAELKRVLSAGFGEIGGEVKTGISVALKDATSTLAQLGEKMGETLLKATKGSLGIASPSREFKKIGENVGRGFELGAVASMDKAFDALERQLQERLKRLQSILSLAPSRRSAFPFVATGGALESGPIAREIDQAYAQIAKIQERRQERLTAERGSLTQMAGRLLPPARDRSLPAARETIFPGGGALDQVTQGFVQSLRNTRDTLARNFSANTYLPRATRALATSMDVATKQLSGTKIAGLLPSKEMMEPLRFQRAQQKAAQIDAENIARAQAEQALNQQNLRGMFQGVPRINAPRVGQEETPIGKHIQNKIEQAIQNARQTLGLPLGPSSTFVPSPFANAATVPPRQFFQPTMQAALPPAGGTGPIAAAQRNIAEMQKNNDRMLASANRAIATIDRIIEAGRGITGNAPSAPPSQSGFAAWSQQMTAKYSGGNVPPIPPVPPVPPGGGGAGGMGGFGGFGRAMGGINLPGAGTIRELGDEFGFATKQVLLFGQAYKLLGFIQSFPGQVATAVSALQSFRNTLGAISPTAKEAQLSNELILALVEKYNIPLESARQGFTKLYASMQPAGFSGAEISKLFTGISKASATLGLSSDKVDRVTYAFSQMASKGQLMSEEVSGQLGDVIPGALSTMAEAAGMDIAKFKKAMEDGEFVGARFTEVMNKVPEVLEKRFGKGAEGAAKTFQGAMNNMQTSVTLFYESFEPAAVAFLNMFVTPISRQLKDLADGFTAFFNKTNAQTIGGQGIADELNKLRPAFEGIIANMQAFVPTLKTIGDVALGVAKAFTVIAGNPITGMLAKVYVQILLLTTAFKIFTANAIAQTIRSLIGMVTQIGLTNNAMVLLQKNAMSAQMQMALLTAKTGNMAGAFQSGSLAVTGLGAAIKSALLGGVITAAILIIDQLINRIQQLKAEADAVKARGKGSRVEVKAAYAGGVESGRSMAAQKEAEARSASRLSALYRDIAAGKQISDADFALIQEMGGMTMGLQRRQGGGYRAQGGGRINLATGQAEGDALLKEEFKRRSLLAAQTAESIRSGIAQGSREGEEYAAAQASRTAKEQRKLEEDLTKDKKGNADKLANQQQQAAIDAANSQNALNKAIMEGRMSLDDQAFQHQLALIDARNSYELAGLNSIQARQEKFQQDLQKLELDRISIIRKAEQDAAKAVADYRAAENTAAAAGDGGGKGLPSGMTQYITGDPSSPYYQADHGGGNYHEHLAFASRALAEAAYQQLTKAGVQVTEFKGVNRVGRHTPGSAHYAGLAFDVPGAQVPVGQEKQLTAKVQSIIGIGGGIGARERRSDRSAGKLQVEQTQMATQQEMAARTAIMATNEALEKRSALIKENINTIFPVAEQKLENDLMKIRNDLQLQGMPQEYIKYQEDLVKANYEMEERIKRNKGETEDYEKALAALQKKQKDAAALTPNETAALKANTEAIAQNKQELQDLTEAQKAYQIAALENAIATMKQADALKALEETSGRINQSVEGVTGTYKDMFKEIAKGGDSVEALKKAQEALADQALTMFFDFAMQPVEKFFKDQLGAMFGLPNEEEQRQKTISAMEAQLKELQAQKALQDNIDKNVSQIANGGAAGAAPQGALTPGGMTVASESAVTYAGEAVSQLPEAFGSLTESASAYAEQLGQVDASVWGTASSISGAASEMGADGPVGSQWQKALGGVVQGLGMAVGSVMGITAGINQIKEGGTSNVLGGIGSIMTSVGGLLGGLSGLGGLFGGGSAGQFGTSTAFNGTAGALGAAPFAPKLGPVFANGGIAHGGFRAFANGGVINGPTLGLVGEGRYNEAVVPLPDGKSIPVTMGRQSSRELLSGNGSKGASSPILSMSFQSTTINGVEYVDRAQLEAAMAETRRLAAREGASQGSQLALSKLKNSPTTRRQLGF